MCEATTPEYAAYHVNDLYDFNNNEVDEFTEEDEAALAEENKSNILAAAREYIERYT